MRSDVRRWLPYAAVVAALVPVVLAPVRALSRGWMAIGDNGLILLRTEDVATANHPLLGTWTSASILAGRAINNPGPLWYDVLAPFVKVGGPSVGFAVGVMIANAAAIVGAAFVARRVGGERAMAIVTMLSAGLTWTMGSELLFDAWQPHSMVLPFWLLLILAWGVTAGDLGLLPWMVGVASLIVQTHLSFVYVIAGVGLAAAVGAGIARWRAGGLDDEGRARGSVRGPVTWSIAVAVVAWFQPLLDQVAGTGNIGALLRSNANESERIGLTLGVRLVASVVASPPWWARPGFTETIRATGIVSTDEGADLLEGAVVGFPAAIVSMFAVFAVLGVVIVVGRRRRSRRTIAIGVTAAVSVAAGLVSTHVMPIGPIGLSPHTMRWLWPISAVVLLAPLLAIGEWLPARRVVTPVAVTLTALLAAMNLPTSAPPLGPVADRTATDTAAALVAQLDTYRPDGPVVFDVSTLRFAEPYSGPVLAALARQGVDVVVTDDGMVHQLGERRRAAGDETKRLVIIEGEATLAPPAGARAIALVDGVSPVELAELDRLRAEALDLAERDGLVLNAAGIAAAGAGRIPFEPTVLPAGGDAVDLEAGGWIGSLVADGFVALTPDQHGPLTRYSELERRHAKGTVGVFELPIERRAGSD